MQCNIGKIVLIESISDCSKVYHLCPFCCIIYLLYLYSAMD